MWRVINYLNFKIKSEIPSVVKVVQLCILYNQRDATYTMFFIINSAPHVSDGFSAYHQELIKLYLQPWVLSCFPAVYRLCGCVGTGTANTVLQAPDDGRKNRPKHV